MTPYGDRRRAGAYTPDAKEKPMNKRAPRRSTRGRETPAPPAPPAPDDNGDENNGDE